VALMSAQAPAPERAPSWLLSLAFAAGNLILFAGERLIGAGSARAVSAAGVALILFAIGARALRMKRARGDERKIERRVLDGYLLSLGAIVFYALQSDLATGLFGGQTMDRNWPRLATTLGALWPALWLAGALLVSFVEMAYASMTRAARLEYGRILDAMMSGLGLAFALVFAFSIAYVAAERDKKVDLSYFRTAKPGEATRKMVRALDQPLQVSLFFPPANEVRERVAEYFGDLQKESKLLEVKSYDHAVDPAKAKELGVGANGIMVVSRGGRREQLSIGLELEQARTSLRNLDKEVQKRLVLVARPGRTVYLVTGHGERAPTPVNETDKRGTVRDLRELLIGQGYSVRDLGAAEGLAADVPNDAAIVALIGPQKPLSPEEIGALGRYYDRGGRLLYALDPEVGLDWKELLAPFGLKFIGTVLANDQAYWARTHTQSDRIDIATGSYSSHPSVTTLGHLGLRAPMVLLGAGALEEVPPKEKPQAAVTADFPVRAHPATWNDANGNFTFDAPAEVRKSWNLSSAIVKKNGKDNEGRALVVADSDALSDGVINNLGNAYFVLDGVKWLLGDEQFAGEISSEADVPVAHTHRQDVIWFYSTIFLAPALVLGLMWYVLRRRARPRKEVA
jgi:gliding motility-associatede transport system auxiliary component